VKEGQLIGIDAAHDLAVLKVFGPKFPFLVKIVLEFTDMILFSF
jgi:hypothetical protein